MHEVFEGNSFEGHTMLDVVHRFQERVGETKPVIVADAAMLSKDNMQKLEDELWLLRVSILLLQVQFRSGSLMPMFQRRGSLIGEKAGRKNVRRSG